MVVAQNMAAFLAESRSKSFCQPCSHPLHHPAKVKKVHMVGYGYFTVPSNSYVKQVLLANLRRHPWKRPWKIDSVSFQTISRSSTVAQLLKRREFMLELKRGGRAPVQTQRVEFIALPFPFSKQIKIWAFHVVVVQGRLRNVQKSVMHVQSCYFAN